jgi:hypothetical protein
MAFSKWLFRVNVISDSDTAVESRASPNSYRATASAFRGLEVRLLAILVAVCAKPVRWFAVLHARFHHASQSSWVDSLKLVTLLLSFPCFKISHLFFKFAYALQQRRLLLLGGEDLFLQSIMSIGPLVAGICQVRSRILAGVRVLSEVRAS